MDSIIAMAVTQIEPVMNGKKPKFPATGCQDEDNKRSIRDRVDNISSDF
jgi:hypothetical protein